MEEVLDSRQIQVLTAKDKGKLNPFQAKQLLKTWAEYTAELEMVQWLGQFQLPSSVVGNVIEFWGHDVIAKLSDDIFRLLAFYDWGHVDFLAVSMFSVGVFDPRRHAAALEQICYQHYEKGNTAVEDAVMAADLNGLLGYDPTIVEASYDAWKDRVCHFNDPGIFQLAGAYTLERFVEEQIKKRISIQRNALFCGPTFDLSKLFQFERRKTEKLKTRGLLKDTEVFEHTDEQRAAIKMVMENAICAIFGGVGVGKTSLLEAIFDQIGAEYEFFPVALTGRAVKVMKDKGAKDAQTISKFICTAQCKAVPHNAWIFVDVACVLDLPTTYRLLETLPETARICFLGDHL